MLQMRFQASLTVPFQLYQIDAVELNHEYHALTIRLRCENMVYVPSFLWAALLLQKSHHELNWLTVLLRWGSMKKYDYLIEYEINLHQT